MFIDLANGAICHYILLAIELAFRTCSNSWAPVVDVLGLKQHRYAQGSNFFFQPADIVTQILNAGLAAPIDVQVRGQDLEANFLLAEQIRNEIAKIPGAVDVHVKQAINGPVINVDVDPCKKH